MKNQLILIADKIRDKMDQSRLLREERVLVQVLVNWIAPLAFFSILSFSRWQYMLVIPVYEQNYCWIYYLTRSPYKLVDVQTSYKDYVNYANFTVNILEQIGLIFFTWQFATMKKTSPINITKESIVVTMVWVTFSLFAFIVHFYSIKLYGDDPVLTVVMLSRNILAVAILYYFSVYKMQNDFSSSTSSLLGEVGEIGLEDFKLAMRSRLPMEYFLQFIQNMKEV